MISMYKKIVALAVLAGFCFFGPALYGAQAAETVDRIVAIVNEDIILLSDVNRHFEPVEQQIRSRGLSSDQETRMLYEARSELINELINEKLADQVIQETGIEVSDGEIDATIERIKDANRLTQESLEQAIRARGMTMEEYREDMRQQILRTKLVNHEVKSKIVITEDDIREHYGTDPEAFGLTEKYRLKNIFMTFGHDRESVRLEMEKVLEELKEGASFAEMAKKHSMAPNANDEGRLGTFALSDLSEHLQPVVAELKPGEFTDIVETELGFQIFYLEDIEEPKEQDLEDAKKKIEQQLYEQKVEEKFDEWIESLRESAHIRIIQ